MRIALIIVRYGVEIVGGAETAARKLTERLAARGHNIEVLTTCLRHLHTSAESYREGRVEINGLPVFRFPVMRIPDTLAEIVPGITVKLEVHVPLSLEEQYLLVDAGIHSPKLYAYLKSNGARYDFLLFSHYWMGLTYYGATLFPNKTVIWPHLHDFEPLTYSVPTSILLRDCLGVVFNSQWEMEFAREKLGVKKARMRVMGLGVEDQQGDAAFFREIYKVDAPFVLYAGQLEQGKNVPLLVDYFLRYKARYSGNLKLVIMGTGSARVPQHPDIVRLGFVPESHKPNVFAAATVLCQPSVRESFSLVIMESWMQGVPVLVHRDCEVTKYHCLRSNGGLYFGDYDEFEACLDFLLKNPDIQAGMGENGRRYVLSNCSWDVIVGRFEEALDSWVELSGPPAKLLEIDRHG